MKGKTITLNLDSGEWKVEIYEIGNTYQLAATKGDEIAHFMIRKASYLNYLKKKQDNQEVKENSGLSWTGIEMLTPKDFLRLRDVLYENMDADLSKEKASWGIVEQKIVE